MASTCTKTIEGRTPQDDAAASSESAAGEDADRQVQPLWSSQRAIATAPLKDRVRSVDGAVDRKLRL